MEENRKNLCAMIPESLHCEVREKQAQAGLTLNDYMTWLIREFYKMEGKSMSAGKKTVAFQVDEELFNRFKAYLKEQGITQAAFFISCMEKVLENKNEQQE